MYAEAVLSTIDVFYLVPFLKTLILSSLLTENAVSLGRKCCQLLFWGPWLSDVIITEFLTDEPFILMLAIYLALNLRDKLQTPSKKFPYQ